MRCACALVSGGIRAIDGVCRVRAGVRLPASHRSIYGYFVDLDSGNFVPWDALIPPTKTLIEKGALSSIGETPRSAGVTSRRLFLICHLLYSPKVS